MISDAWFPPCLYSIAVSSPIAPKPQGPHLFMGEQMFVSPSLSVLPSPPPPPLLLLLHLCPSSWWKLLSAVGLFTFCGRVTAPLHISFPSLMGYISSTWGFGFVRAFHGELPPGFGSRATVGVCVLVLSHIRGNSELFKTLTVGGVNANVWSSSSGRKMDFTLAAMSDSRTWLCPKSGLLHRLSSIINVFYFI